MNDLNIVKTDDDYQKLKKACEISSNILEVLKENVKIGVSALEIDKLAEKLCNQNNVKPAFRGVPGQVRPFLNSVCVSTNDEILHAIPRENRVFKSGDIVKVDFGVIYEGFFTDHCTTIGLGELTEKEKSLISNARFSIESAVKKAIVGNKVGDISLVLEEVPKLGGFDVVSTYCGHGIGKALHLPPEIPAWGGPGLGPVLEEGMILCIENQVVLGSADLVLDNDGWTLKTIDGSKGAMFEQMVIVRKGEVERLTKLI